jgi:hypothetical protein
MDQDFSLSKAQVEEDYQNNSENCSGHQDNKEGKSGKEETIGQSESRIILSFKKWYRSGSKECKH